MPGARGQVLGFGTKTQHPAPSTQHPEPLNKHSHLWLFLSIEIFQ
jgi:hypothetical protein